MQVLLSFMLHIIDEPWVYTDPRVFHNTLERRVRCVPLPNVGAVSTGAGVVSLSPTHTVPVPNPIDQFPTIQICCNQDPRWIKLALLVITHNRTPADERT